LIYRIKHICNRKYLAGYVATAMNTLVIAW